MIRAFISFEIYEILKIIIREEKYNNKPSNRKKKRRINGETCIVIRIS